MKLYCNGLDLADSFSKVTRAISGKSNVPILEGVKIEAYGDKLTLTASDTEITIENTITAKIMLEGEIVVPGKLMSELVKKMGSQQVELECLDEKVLNIKYMDSTTKIMLYKVDEYPKFNENNYDNTFSMLQNQFKDMVNKTAFCAAIEESRPILKGCLLKVKGKNISMVAIDGLRLAITKQQLTLASGEFNAVVPARALNEISRLAGYTDDIITISVSNKKIMADMGHTKIVALLMDGEFVNYERIIPKESVTEIKVNSEQLEQTLDRVSIISRTVQANLIKIEMNENVMKIEANSDIGNINEKVPVSMEGKDMRLALNSKFLSDCLKAIDKDYIKINFSSSIHPCTITPISGDEFLYLILPVRLMGWFVWNMHF